jgi:M6 family metalloprotease-like protein
MKKTRLLITGFVAALILVAVSFSGALAVDTMPPPVDPQSWSLQRDMTWDDWTPNPVVNWQDKFDNGYRGAARHFKAALVLIDFPDRPFDITLPKYSNAFGNPQIDPIPNDPAAIRKYWGDFLNKPGPENYYTTFNEFLLENTFGDWSCDLDVFGPYTLPGFEFQYGLSEYATWATYAPPGFTNLGGSYQNHMFTAIEDARELDYRNYSFVFFLHAGNDESGVWCEFGEQKWDTREEVSYEFGPLAALDRIIALGYGSQVSEAAYTWAKNKNENGGNWAATRYTSWTSWLSAASIWSYQSSASRRNPFTGTNQTVLFSVQSEDCGMATFAHEFGHVMSLPDNYSSPFYYNREFTGPWDLMSRGCFSGPGGDHERWRVPGNLGGSIPTHMMMNTKMWSSNINFIKSGEYLALNYNTLATMTPQVAHIASREVPVGAQWGVNALKGIRITNLADKQPTSNAWDALRCTVPSPRPATMTIYGYTYPINGGYSVSSSAFTGMTVEVVDQVGYDSFLNDHGVLISRTKASGSNNGNSWVVDANPGALDIVDFIKPGGQTVKFTYGNQVQLANSAFHAGLGDGINNEWHDPYNFLKFYILDKHYTPNQFGEVLSYDIGVLRTDGVPVGGELDVKVADVEKETPGRVAIVNFSVTNTGPATDIIRVGVDGYLGPVLLNNLYAVGAGATITVPVYVELPPDIRTRDVSGKVIDINVSSESNANKVGSASVKIEDVIKYNYTVYLAPHRTEVFFGETFLVDLMLVGDINYSQIATEISYDPDLLEFAGHQDLIGWAASVTKTAANIVAVRSVPAMNMVVGLPCNPDIKIVTLKFMVKENIAESIVDTKLCFASAVVSPPGGVTGTGVTPGKCVTIKLREFEPLPDGEIARRMVINAPHAGENCTEHAITVKEFGPGSAYGPIMTTGVEDPFFGGGMQFMPTQKTKVKIYVLAVDFEDLKGDNPVAYGLQSSIITSGSSTYDMTYPEVIYNMIFFGANGLRALPEHKFVGSGSVTLKAIKQRLEEMSMGRMQVEVECLNEKLAVAQGLDPLNDKWPWFHLEGPMFEYAVQGPADCEDYRQFARLHQAGIDAAYRDIPGLDIEDIDFIYTITPVSSHGYRSGLQGGSGLDTSFSFNDQALIQRDSEYRHEPGIKTKGGRVVGSGVFGVKGVTRSPSASITTSMHELTHGLGMFDDYSYGSLGTNTGESTGSGTGAWGVMGSNMGTTSPDLPIWRKFRMGWIDDDEITVVLPGENVTLNLRAISSFTGDGGTYANDPNIKTRMVLIPKEYRTRDTFGMNNSDPWIGGTVWTNGWNPNRLAYNWYDWFTNPFIGGETNALKSWPTFYTLECRKQLGIDSGMTAGNTGVVVSYIANPTTETGHGAGGFKIVSGATGLRASGTAAWSDNNIGLTVRVNSSNVFYDNVTITYTGQKAGTSAATKYYTALLKVTDNYAAPGQAFTVDFDLMTMGRPGVNDGTAAPGNATKTSTPVGVPGGIAGFTLNIEFDAANLEFVAAVSSPFTCIVDRSGLADGKLVVKGSSNQMVDLDSILTVNFKPKAGAALGNYTIKGTITDVTLLNWRGRVLGRDTVPGFDGVATIGNGTFAQFHSNNNLTVTPGITGFGGRVTVGAVPTYTLTGTVVCETPGPIPGGFIGVESTVTVYNSGGVALGASKSDWDGNYTIKGIPAGNGYYVQASKPKFVVGRTAAFDVSGQRTVAQLQLKRQTFTVSGTVYGAVNSDGSGATPLAGVDVYLVNTGNAYSVIGGPVKTNAQGQYSVDGMEVGKAFAAVAVSVKGTQYESLYLPHLHLAPNLHLPQAGITQPLELNLGYKYGENGADYVYPANTTTLGASNLYCFALTANRTGRNLTLTETQDVRIRITTKSNQIRYQLRDMDGNAVGAQVSSLGTSNGDDIIRNVAPGEYYIEASRTGYISGCTMPFKVTSTRVILRNAVGTNYMDLLATGSGNTISGTVVNALTGAPLEGVKIVCTPYSTGYGAGAPIFTTADGKFSYLVVTGARDLAFSKAGFVPKSIYLAAGNHSGLVIELMPLDTQTSVYEIIVNFPGFDGVTVEHSNGALKTVLPGTFNATTGVTPIPVPSDTKSVKVIKGVMEYEFDTLVFKTDGPLVLNVPIDTITPTGIGDACNLGLTHGGIPKWVYPLAPVSANGQVSFLVFNNGKPYEVQLTKAGFFDIERPDAFAGQSIQFGQNYFYQITVPTGISKVKITSNGTIVDNVGEGTKINLLCDFLGTIREAQLTFEYNNVTYNVTFLLDGSDPFEIYGAIAFAKAEHITGNQSKLTITVTEYLYNPAHIITREITIENNAVNTYQVGPCPICGKTYTVYVDVKGTDQIRECRIVQHVPAPDDDIK